MVVVHIWLLYIYGCCTCMVVVRVWLLYMCGCCTRMVVVCVWLLYMCGCCTCMVVVVVAGEPASDAGTRQGPGEETLPAGTEAGTTDPVCGGQRLRDHDEGQPAEGTRTEGCVSGNNYLLMSCDSLSIPPDTDTSTRSYYSQRQTKQVYQGVGCKVLYWTLYHDF